MSLQTRIAALITAVGADIKDHTTRILALESKQRVAGVSWATQQNIGLGTETMITGANDFNITVPTGGARYRFTADIQVFSTVANDGVTCRIKDGGASAPVVASTTIWTGRKQGYISANTAGAIAIGGVEFDLTAGTHRIGLSILTVNGTGTIGGTTNFLSSVQIDKVT